VIVAKYLAQWYSEVCPFLKTKILYVTLFLIYSKGVPWKGMGD
jgi:hypothetical protein